MDLSREQRDAVERTGQDVCCTAGPGSGKTRVLVERYAWLIQKGVDPDNILAITFTDKAATEIKSRLAKRFEGDQGLLKRIERAPISTVHAFCQRMLRENAIAAGLDPDFRIMDDHASDREKGIALTDVLDRFALTQKDAFLDLVRCWGTTAPVVPLRETAELLRAQGGIAENLRDLPAVDPQDAIEQLVGEARSALAASVPGSDSQSRVAAAVRGWLSERPEVVTIPWLQQIKKCKIGNQKPGFALKDAYPRIQTLLPRAEAAATTLLFGDRLEMVREILLAYEEEYDGRKRAMASLDFQDLEIQARDLLARRRDVREEARDRYKHILMDELQDTNPLQWSILDLIRSRDTFFAVGDINQSIFAFRFAQPSLFAEFEERTIAGGGIVDTLKDNYRSRPEILNAVTRLVPSLPGVRQHQLAEKRGPLPDSQPAIEMLAVEDGDEAAWIAWRLAELKQTLLVTDEQRPAKWGDFAILVRTSSPIAELEPALQRAGIPYVVTRGKGFFEEPEIIDSLNFLRVLDTPQNEIALAGLLRSPFFGVGDEAIYRGRLSGALAPEEASQRIEGWRRQRLDVPADILLSRALDESGYLRKMDAAARANIRKFLRMLRQLMDELPGDLPQWIARLQEVRAGGTEPAAPSIEELDAVRIVTMHSAKGLEFPVVFLAFLKRGGGTDKDELVWSRQFGLGAKWRVPGCEEKQPDLRFLLWKEARQRTEESEEDRLLYVATTRAEDRLIFSWGASGKGEWADRIDAAFAPQWPDSRNTMVASDGFLLGRLAGEPPVIPVAGRLGVSEPPSFPPSVPEFQIPASISVTSLMNAAECPRRYYLGNVIRWPVEAANEAADLGSQVHAALAGLPSPDAPAEAQELAAVFQNSELGRRAAEAKRSGREVSFLVDADPMLVEGQIDLWFEDSAGRIVLVDYKASRTAKGPALDRYKLQLQCYDFALERMLGRPVDEAWLFFLRSAEAVGVELGAAAAAGRNALLEKFLKGPGRGEFPLNPGHACKYCPYLGKACPAPLPEGLRDQAEG